MKVICDRATLLDAVNTVSGAVAARTPRLQLTCIKLVASKPAKGPGTLELLGTDAEVAVRLTVTTVDVQEPGEALIPADKLRQIVSAEENEPTLTIEAQQDVCHIRGQDARFKVFGQPPAEFPPLPDFAAVVAGSKDAAKAKGVLSQTAGTLASLVTRTLFAAAKENSRYAINGVLLKRDGKRIEMVATDGRRMAVCRAPIAGPTDKEAKALHCIIPAKGLSMLQKLIRDPEETITIAVTDNQALFRFGGEEKTGEGARAMLATNLVEGAFPPYEEAIPREQDIKVVIDRDVLASAVRRAGLLTNEESRGVRMSFSGTSRQLKVKSRAPEMGESDIDVPLLEYNGQDIEIGFNPAFIGDALKVIADTQVLVELKAPAAPGGTPKPALMKSNPKQGAGATGDFLYVVMPVNLQ